MTAGQDPGPQKYSGTTPVLFLRRHAESGPSMLDCDAPQAQPVSLCPQTRANKHIQLHKHVGWGPGKPTRSPLLKKGVGVYGSRWSWCCNIVFRRSYIQVHTRVMFSAYLKPVLVQWLFLICGYFLDKLIPPDTLFVFPALATGKPKHIVCFLICPPTSGLSCFPSPLSYLRTAWNCFHQTDLVSRQTEIMQPYLND